MRSLLTAAALMLAARMVDGQGAPVDPPSAERVAKAVRSWLRASD